MRAGENQKDRERDRDTEKRINEHTIKRDRTRIEERVREKYMNKMSE